MQVPPFKNKGVVITAQELWDFDQQNMCVVLSCTSKPSIVFLLFFLFTVTHFVDVKLLQSSFKIHAHA